MTGNQASVNPFDILRRDHALAVSWLERLDRAALSIVDDGFSTAAFRQIAEVIGYINTEFRLHDRREEQFLFPLLERHLSGSTGPYRAEHRQLWSAFDRLQKSVGDVEMSKLHGSSIRELVDASRQLSALLRDHIRKENNDLLPQAAAVLTAEESSHLGDCFADPR